MHNRTHHATITAAMALLIAAGAGAQQLGMQRTVGTYEGRWEVQPNGDVHVTRTYTLPLATYRQWKATDRHMMEMRNYHPRRSIMHVTDIDHEWDDSAKTLVITMAIRGMAGNNGKRWQGRIMPGLTFSNINQGERTAYFHASATSPYGAIDGKDLIVLPDGATNIKWDEGDRVITYELRATGGNGITLVWWVLTGLCFAVAVALWVASFAVSRGGGQGAAAAGGPPPAQMPPPAQAQPPARGDDESDNAAGV
ncbi:MAG: hypothetical protein ACOC7R_04355 [Planctomycetota bacterium]